MLNDDIDIYQMLILLLLRTIRIFVYDYAIVNKFRKNALINLIFLVCKI